LEFALMKKLKKSFSPLLLLLASLPLLALAGGDHADGHGHANAPAHEHAHERAAAPSAAGQPGDPAKVSRTIELVMDDSMRFTPDSVAVKAGETVRFFVRNKGKLKHEMVIGPMDELKAHAEMMRSMPDMQHTEPNMLTLKPGQRGALVWRFDQPGTVDFACLVPGHMEAGMAAKVQVGP
jgi:uncharacterized cupredoxin-like copper-binding protein